MRMEQSVKDGVVHVTTLEQAHERRLDLQWGSPRYERRARRRHVTPRKRARNAAQWTAWGRGRGTVHVRGSAALRSTSSELERGAAVTVQSRAIACNHVQSRAIACSHVQSRTVTCNRVQSRAIACNRVQSRAVTCNRVQSRAVECSHVQSRAIACNRVQSRAISYNRMQSGAIKGVSPPCGMCRLGSPSRRLRPRQARRGRLWILWDRRRIPPGPRRIPLEG